MCEEELLDRIIQRLGTELKELHGKVVQGQVSAATVETLVRRQLWHFGAQVTGVLLEALDRQLTAQRAVHDRRTRTVLTLFGPVDLTRSRCRDGSYPLDECLGLIGRHAWTTGVQEAVSLLSCECSFETTGQLLERLLGLVIRAPSVQVAAEEAGRRAGPLLAKAPPPTDTAAGKTLIVATDGCQAPEREGWHEVKVATLYANERRCRKASGRGKVLSKEYLASLSDAEDFGRQLWQRAWQWQVERARGVVCMGDGAPWIWNLAAEHFPGAVEIVDYYHAVEHLWTAAEALWGERERSEATRGWVRHYRRRLKEGRADLVIEALGRAPAGRRLSESAATAVRRNLEYFRTNRQRMCYDRYRREKLPIGTGMVEGSCKFVVQSRFKRPGSRWSREGLDRMLALKLLRLNHHWERLWPHLKAG
jgi:hypothetical protein